MIFCPPLTFATFSRVPILSFFWLVFLMIHFSFLFYPFLDYLFFFCPSYSPLSSFLFHVSLSLHYFTYSSSFFHFLSSSDTFIFCFSIFSFPLISLFSHPEFILPPLLIPLPLPHRHSRVEITSNPLLISTKYATEHKLKGNFFLICSDGADRLFRCKVLWPRMNRIRDAFRPPTFSSYLFFSFYCRRRPTCFIHLVFSLGGRGYLPRKKVLYLRKCYKKRKRLYYSSEIGVALHTKETSWYI